MSSDLEIRARLIREYQRLMNIRRSAVEEGAVKTLEIIDREIEYIKVILQPLELPED